MTAANPEEVAKHEAVDLVVANLEVADSVAADLVVVANSEVADLVVVANPEVADSVEVDLVEGD